MSPASPQKTKRRRRILAGLGAMIVVGLLSGLAAQQIPRFRIKEESSREFFRKGVYFYNQRQYVAAREFFYKALDVQPSFHLARRYAGDAHYYAGEWNQALEQWELLETLSGGAYPLIRQRSELLRFGLYRTRDPGPFTFLREFTPLTFRGERYERPTDLAIDPDGNVFVLSFGSSNLLQVNPAGELQRVMRGPFYDRLDGPLAMAYADDQLFICDYSDDRVRVLHKTGRSLRSFGETGSGPGQMRGPEGIALSKDSVFVSDSGNRRILRFTREGEFKGAFGADDLGRHPPAPAGLLVKDKRLYAVDREERALRVYDLDGNYLERIGYSGLRRPRAVASSAQGLVVTDEESGILFYHLGEQRWRHLGKLRDANDREIVMNRPFAARMDKNGVLYMAEYGGHRVLTVVPEGLRTSNLEVRVERVDRRDFPDMAVFVSVRNRLGRPLRGITGKRLRLFENDRRVGGLGTDNLKPYQNRTNLVIVKEHSTFLEKEFPGMATAALGRVIENIRIADRIRLVRVGGSSRTVYQGLERRALLEQLAKGSVSSSPNLGKGLMDGVSSLLDGLGPRAVVLFASGKDFAGAFDQYDRERVIQYAAANQIPIYVISCEGAEDEMERKRAAGQFRDMASRTGGLYLRAYDETGLSMLYDKIRRSRDERYVITYRSQADRRLKGRYVDVRVEARHMGTRGKGTGGYFIP